MKAVLSIAGSDSIGGAGIQADIKTMTLNGVYAMSVVTALTAQNTMGVTGIQETPPEFLKMQIDAVFEDIRPAAVKIGMVSSEKLICAIEERLKFYKAENVVVDPVMVSTSGSSLIKEKSTDALTEKLFPLADVVTPNIPEAEILSGIKISTKDEMKTAAKKIGDLYGCAVLLKGGHSMEGMDDLLYKEGEYTWFKGKKIQNPNTHGTGCTLSSAIAANLAKGYDLKSAVKRGKDFTAGAIAAFLDLGKGAGPMNHAFDVKSLFAEEKVIY